MTLTVRQVQDDARHKETILNMREANGSRIGGNDVEMRNSGRDGFEISLTNEDFSVDITHKTAEKLFRALAGTSNGEYFLYCMLRDHLDQVYYKKLWTKLGQQEEEQDQ